jgi:hypothetical protein
MKVFYINHSRGKKRDFRTPEVRRKYEGSTGEHGGVRESTRKYEEVQGSMRKYEGVPRKYQGSTRGVQGITRDYEGVRGSTRKYEGVRGSTREYERSTRGVRGEYEGSTREYEEVWEVRKSRFFSLVDIISNMLKISHFLL